MASPPFTASSHIPSEAYFADLYAYFASNAATHAQAHAHPAKVPTKQRPGPDRTAPHRPCLDFGSALPAPYLPSFSFLPPGTTSPQIPLTPDSPVWELSDGALEEKYTPGSLSLGKVERVGGEVDGNARRVSAQKLKRRAQNRVAQRKFRARQTERVAELEREVEGLRTELEMLKSGSERCHEV